MKLIFCSVLFFPFQQFSSCDSHDRVKVFSWPRSMSEVAMDHTKRYVVLDVFVAFDSKSDMLTTK